MAGESPSTYDAGSAANGVQGVSDDLGSVHLPGDGNASEAAQRALDQAQQHARVLASSAAALHESVGRHNAAEATHRTNAPSEEEIAAAKDRVAELADKVAAGEASQSDLDQAIDDLSNLLAQKDEADKERDAAHLDADDDLTRDASDLTDPSANPAMYQQPQQPPMGGDPGTGGMPMGASPGAGDPFGQGPDMPYDPDRRLGNDSMDGSFGPPDLDGLGGEGRTQLAGADIGGASGAGGHGHTMVGKFDEGTSGSKGPSAVSSGGSSGSGSGSRPMGGGMMGGGMPMGMGHGMGGAGDTKDRRKDFTVVEAENAGGQDIDDKYGTSGDIDESVR